MTISPTRWLWTLSVITLLVGGILFGYGTYKSNKDIANAEKLFVGMSEAERDELVKADTGMTWAQAVAFDHHQVRVPFLLHLGLAAWFAAMGALARKQAPLATILALAGFVGVAGWRYWVDTRNQMQFLVFDVFLLIVLVRAVVAAISAGSPAPARDRAPA